MDADEGRSKKEHAAGQSEKRRMGLLLSAREGMQHWPPSEERDPAVAAAAAASEVSHSLDQRELDEQPA